MMTRKALRSIILVALALWAALFYLFAIPAQAQTPPEVDLVLNCGTLQGSGSAVVRIYGKTFAILAIHCEKV
jgi:hypothetical protein